MVAETQLSCYWLSGAAFSDLLGPLEDVWRFEVLKQVGARGVQGVEWAGEGLAHCWGGGDVLQGRLGQGSPIAACRLQPVVCRFGCQLPLR